MTGSNVSAATAAVIRTGVAVSAVSAAVVLVGGSVTWLLERHAPGSTFGSWGDSLWWALPTLTTVGYGDHVPVTTAGRLVGAPVMIAVLPSLGGVAAGVALTVARAVAVVEEQALEADAESLEQRLESRLDALDARLAVHRGATPRRRAPARQARPPTRSHPMIRALVVADSGRYGRRGQVGLVHAVLTSAAAGLPWPGPCSGVAALVRGGFATRRC